MSVSKGPPIAPEAGVIAGELWLSSGDSQELSRAQRGKCFGSDWNPVAQGQRSSGGLVTCRNTAR